MIRGKIALFLLLTLLTAVLGAVLLFLWLVQDPHVRC